MGIGTVYRHFPSRDDLIDAVLEDVFDDVVAVGESILEEADAWEGLKRYLEEMLVMSASNPGVRQILTTGQHGGTRAAAMRTRVSEIFAELVERARAQGALRSDFAPADIALVYWSCDRVLELTGEVAPDLWRRQLGFALAGLRADAEAPLPHPPLTAAQEERIFGPSDRRSA